MKKLFTLLTMLVLGIGSMWADDVATPTSKTYGKKAIYQSVDVLSSTEIPTGTYYIKCKSSILVGFTNPFVVDPGSDSEMNLYSESKLSGDYGKWVITNNGYGTGEGSSTIKYTIQSVVRNTHYWKEGGNAPLGTTARSYSIIYDADKGAYRFLGHVNEGTITNRGYVYPIYGSGNKFGRDNSDGKDANAAALYELIPADKVTLEDEICLQNVPHTKWNVTAPNQYGGTGDEGGCANIKDESLSTFYHSDWANGHKYDGRSAKKGEDGLQAFMIDIGEPLEEIVGFAYRARPNNPSGHAKKVRVYAYETLPTDFPTDLSAMSYEKKQDLLKRENNTVLGTPYFDNYNEEWSYSNNNDYKTGMLSQPVKARYILFIQDSGQDAWLTCSDFQIYQNMYITNDKPYLLKIKGKDLYIDTYNGKQSNNGKTFVTAATGTPTYFTLKDSQWQISSTKNRQANFVSIATWDAIVKQSTASNWTIQKADNDSYYLSQNTYYGGSDLKKHYLGANNGSISGADIPLYTDKATSEAVKIQFEPATEYTVSSNLDQGGIIYLGGTYIKGETFGGISGLTKDAFECVTISGYVSEISVDGTTVTVTYEDDDPSIYRVKSGENITLSNIEDLADKSWIIVAENGILTVDEDYDLTKIAGAGTIVIDADVTLSDSKSTYATGKLTINEGKTLTIGTHQNQTNSISSFTSIELAGTIKHNNSVATLNNVTVPADKTGKILAYDMGTTSDGFRLAGTTTLTGGLAVCNVYNFQMKVDALAGTGILKVCGSDNGNFKDDGTTSAEEATINIASASTFTGAVNVNNTQATATVQGDLGACTLQKTNGTLKYTGLNLNSTTMDGVTLASNERITVQGVLNLANITNNLTAGNTGYVFVGKSGVNVTMNFTGNSDLTNGGNNLYNKIGFATGSFVNVNSGSLKLGGYFNGSNSNGSIYVASGASFETTGSSGSNQNIIFPSSTIAGTAKINGDWQGTSTITLNDGAVLEVTKTVAGKLTVADGASVTVRATSTADLTKYGDASYSDESDGLKIQGYKIATDESSNVTAVNIGDNTYDVSGGLFSADDGIYHVLTEVSTSSKDISSNNILVANNATLTVDDNLTMADGKKITAESGGSIAINEGFTLDASAQAANRTEHRGLITAASGDGTLKLRSGLELITASDPNDNDLVVNTNIEYTNEGRVQLIGTEREHDHLVISAGKSFSVNGDLDVMRSKLTVNGTVVANTIKLGHSADGAYTGVLNINGGATVQTGQIYFQNKGGNSRLNMTGGTLEFKSDNDIESAIGKKTDATYSISITGGTIKASANATIPAGIAMSIGDVTIETADEKSLAMSNDLTLTGTITNNGTLSLGGALSADALTVFDDGGEGSSYSDGTNGFLSAKKNIVANGDGASTSLTAEQITVGGTDYNLEHEGTGRATVSTEGTSGAYYINEGGDTQYSTVVAKLSTEGDNIVLNGGVLTMDDEYSKPISMARNSTVVVSEGTSLSQGNITGDYTLTINGAGTYNTNYSASVGLGATLGSNWTGTVARANGVVGGPFNINNMVNGSMSKAQLTHVSGWIQQGFNTTANIVLVNGVEPDDYGFLITGVNDGASYKFTGSISGDGDFRFHQTNDQTYGDARTPKFEFSGDLSNWNGRFNLSNNGTGKYAEIKVTSTGNINAGFANTAVKASQMKLIFNSNEDQNINGDVSKSENGILYMKLLGTGAKTIAADIDVSRLKIVKDNNGAEITLSGKPEIKVGQLDAYTDDNETSTTSLNIILSDYDITTQWLADNASCTLIDVADKVNVTEFKINGRTEYAIGDYKYCIIKDASNDIVLVKHYARIVTSGNFGSICLPNASTSWSGIAKVLKVTEVTDNSVVMEEVDEMVAGVPYIFKSNDGTIDVALEGETVDGPVNDPEGYLVGNFAATAVPNSTLTQINYVLQSNQFKKVTSSTITSGRNRCYLTVDVSSSRLSTLGIAVDEDGATGIDAINSLMDNNAEIYDLNGRKQKDLQKGINIVNGVKVIVK